MEQGGQPKQIDGWRVVPLRNLEARSLGNGVVSLACANRRDSAEPDKCSKETATRRVFVRLTKRDFKLATTRQKVGLINVSEARPVSGGLLRTKKW